MRVKVLQKPRLILLVLLRQQAPVCRHTFAGMVWRGMHVSRVTRCWRFDTKPDSCCV